jgi:hypothetical protein
MAVPQGDSAALRRAVVSNMARRVAAQRTTPTKGTVRKLGVRGPTPPDAKGVPPAVPDDQQRYDEWLKNRYARHKSNSTFDGRNWSTPSGAVIGTSKWEDEPRRPVYSNRKKTAPLR